MKVKLLFTFFLLFYAAIIVRLFYLQALSKNTGSQDLYLKTLSISPERGKIYDRGGNPLVLNQNSYLLYVEPKKITDKTKVIETLAEKLKIDEATLSATINDKLVYQAVKGGLSEEEKKAVEKEKLAGVGFSYQMRRFYPEASLSAHLTGFVGKDEKGDDLGYFGLEGFYDKDLKGLPGFLETERDILGRPIFVGTQSRVEPENGRDLYLTIIRL